MKKFVKKDMPLWNLRRYLEPGPVVLVSSAWKGAHNIMAMGWHMIMEFQPLLIGCYIWTQNHSFGMIRKSKECVFNLPTVDLASTVVSIGNSSGRDIDKFKTFQLTPEPALKVSAPLIKECYANFECKLIDSSLVNKYSLFIFEVVKAHAATAPKFPQTIHYRGDGQIMVSGPTVSKYRKQFKPENL